MQAIPAGAGESTHPIAGGSPVVMSVVPAELDPAVALAVPVVLVGVPLVLGTPVELESVAPVVESPPASLDSVVPAPLDAAPSSPQAMPPTHANSHASLRMLTSLR
jgi:hypothetical protein